MPAHTGSACSQATINTIWCSNTQETNHLPKQKYVALPHTRHMLQGKCWTLNATLVTCVATVEVFEHSPWTFFLLMLRQLECLLENHRPRKSFMFPAQMFRQILSDVYRPAVADSVNGQPCAHLCVHKFRKPSVDHDLNQLHIKCARGIAFGSAALARI